MITPAKLEEIFTSLEDRANALPVALRGETLVEFEAVRRQFEDSIMQCLADLDAARRAGLDRLAQSSAQFTADCDAHRATLLELLACCQRGVPH